jgi:hypothetical protein
LKGLDVVFSVHIVFNLKSVRNCEARKVRKGTFLRYFYFLSLSVSLSLFATL